jgi:hypothetical protein
MPKTKRKNRRRDIKTKRIAGFAPQTVARRLTAIEEGLSRNRTAVLLRIVINNLIRVLREKYNYYEDYKENLQSTYGYNYRFNTTVSRDLIRQLYEVLGRIKYLIRLYDEPGFLEDELRINSYDSIVDVIESTFGNMNILDENIRLYPQYIRDEYTKAELGIVNNTSRRADAITINPDSVRTTALIRRIRSR